MNTATGAPRDGTPSRRWVAPYSAIIGIALGSIIAAIITAQPTVNAIHRRGGRHHIVIIMSSSPRRLDRTTDTHAAAATHEQDEKVRTVARSQRGAGASPGSTACALTR